MNCPIVADLRIFQFKLKHLPLFSSWPDLDPAIHALTPNHLFIKQFSHTYVDTRVKRGHDENGGVGHRPKQVWTAVHLKLALMVNCPFIRNSP